MFHGTVTADDIRHSVEQVRTDSRFATLVYRINDFDAVTKVDGLKATLAHAALRTIGDSKVNIKILVAIVATDPDVRALAELYSSPSYLPYPAKIFDRIAQARAWIEASI